MSLLRAALEARTELPSTVSREMYDLLAMAAKDPELGDFIYQKDLANIKPFTYNDKLVGFAIPRKESDGRWRTGPIYVHPDYRRYGIASAFIKGFYNNPRRPGRVYISTTNIASQRAFTKAGFRKTSKTIKDDDGVLEEYLIH